MANHHKIFNQYAKGEITRKEAMALLHPEPTTKQKLKVIALGIGEFLLIGLIVCAISALPHCIGG